MKRFKNILYVTESVVTLKAFQHAVDLAERNNARLTVVAVLESIPPYLTRLTPHMLRKCPCPVWLTKSTESAAIGRVMACVDFDDLDPSDQDATEPLNREIIELAGYLAFVERSEFHIVHA